MHSDGRVREEAVAAMLKAPYPGLIPFLLLRTADWARGGLTFLWYDNSVASLVTNVELSQLLERWHRGGFGSAQLRVAALRAPEEFHRRLAAHPTGMVRRFALDVALSAGHIAIRNLVSIADTDSSARLRKRYGTWRKAATTKCARWH